MSSNSPMGVSPLAKRTRELERVVTSLKTSSPRRSLDFAVERGQEYPHRVSFKLMIFKIIGFKNEERNIQNETQFVS